MIHWEEYAPKATGRVREDTEWGITYTYHNNDTRLPRVLLVGDSICNGYQDRVRELLEGRVNVTFWASSKCVTEPDYFKELLHMASARRYDVISFNNGLHSLDTAPAAWAEAYEAAVRMLRDACPGATLFLTLSTPLRDPALTAKSAALNRRVLALAEAKALSVIDLFSLMDPLDRETYWRDTYHYHSAGIELQAAKIAEAVLSTLG